MEYLNVLQLVSHHDALLLRCTYTGSKYEVNTYIPGYRVEVISQWQAIKFIHSPSYCGEPFVT
jgi:hypothetical protein